MAIIDRNAASATIPDDVARQIIQGVPTQSVVLQLARQLPNMTRAQQRLPVLSVLPTAYFIDGDIGRKQTTSMAWENKFIVAEELATIVPIPEAVLDDSDYDIWGEVRPRIEEAMAAAIDRAILMGINAPAAWPDDLLTGAIAAGNTRRAGGAGTDVYDDVMGVGGVIDLVESDGFMVNGHVAAATMRARLRALRDTAGNPIFSTNMQQANQYILDGAPILFPQNGALDPATALLISGDWNQLVYSIRQDLSYKILDQAVIQNPDGSIMYNLPQQDMLAMRFVMRLGWQIPNSVSRANPNAATRFPFAALRPAV